MVGACLADHWETWQLWGADAWAVQVLHFGYQVPFRSLPLLSPVLLPLPSYSPSSIRGLALTAAVSDLLAKEAIKLAPPLPGFYSCLFVTPKVTGGWRLVIDLSRLNGFVDVSHFHMETTQTVLQPLREGDWLVSLDLQDAYLQVPVHPSSRRYFRFCVGESVYQFRALCFGLSMAPQVFTHVMAPVSSDHASPGVPDPPVPRRLAGPGFHLTGVCSGEGLPSLALPASWDSGQPSQELLDTPTDSGLSRDNDSDYSFEGFPDPQADPEALSSAPGLSVHPVTSSVRLEAVVGDHVLDVGSGSRLPTAHEVSSAPPQCCWSPSAGRLPCGLGLRLPSGSSVVVRRLSSTGRHASGRVSPRPLSVHRHVGHRLGCLSRRQPSLRLVVSPLFSVFHQSPGASRGVVGSLGFPAFPLGTCCSGVLRQHHRLGVPQETGGTRSTTLNTVAQSVLRFCEEFHITLLPQFIPGKMNVLADSLSCRNQVIGSEWTLCAEAFRQLLHRWPTTIDLFATSLNHRLPVYFSPMVDPQSAGTDAMLQSWDGLQVYAFPPFGLLSRVLAKVRQSHRLELTLIAPFWPQHPWFPDLLELLVEVPSFLPHRRDLLKQPPFHHYHQNLPVLQLTAWHISSDQRAIPVSLRGWLVNLPSVVDAPLW